MKNPNIWQTIEFSCIARDFKHEQYLDILKELEYNHHPVSQESYKELCSVFDRELELDIGP